MFLSLLWGAVVGLLFAESIFRSARRFQRAPQALLRIASTSTALLFATKLHHAGPPIALLGFYITKNIYVRFRGTVHANR